MCVCARVFDLRQRSITCMLQYVAVCRSILQHAPVCCSTLQYVAVCCSMLQCVAAYCNVLQCVAGCYSVLQCVAVCCSVVLWRHTRTLRHWQVELENSIYVHRLCRCASAREVRIERRVYHRSSSLRIFFHIGHMSVSRHTLTFTIEYDH